MLPLRLRQARKYKGYTQEELAKYVNTKKTTISNYETGYSTPSNEMLKDLADNLGTTTDYLLGRSDTPTLSTKTTDLDNWGLSPEDNLFFKDFASLSEEDKIKAKEHIKFLKHLAEQNSKDK